jgi:hypothetical protein
MFWLYFGYYWRHFKYLELSVDLKGVKRNNIVCFLLGNNPASEFYMLTFQNTLFHLYRCRKTMCEKCRGIHMGKGLSRKWPKPIQGGWKGRGGWAHPHLPCHPPPSGSGCFWAKPFPVWIPQHFSNLVILYAYPPMKTEQTVLKTSAYKIQTPGNYPEESIQHSEHGESLKSRM